MVGVDSSSLYRRSHGPSQPVTVWAMLVTYSQWQFGEDMNSFARIRGGGPWNCKEGRRYVDQVGLPVSHSACHSVCRINCCKSNQPISIYWNLMLWLGPISEELLNFWRWSGPGYGFCITFPLPSPLRISGLG